MRLLSNLETTCFRMAQISCQRAQSRGCSSYAECSRDYPNLVPTSAEPRLLRCAMLGRVMMPIGTASCTACNTRFIISPSPSGSRSVASTSWSLELCRVQPRLSKSIQVLPDFTLGRTWHFCSASAQCARARAVGARPGRCGTAVGSGPCAA